jgi:hypothetical protein
MVAKFLRRQMRRPLIVVGAAMTVLVPAVAYANALTVTVETPGATAGPSSTFSEISTDGACASGSYVSGGGIDQAIGTGMSSNGNHVNGTEPSTDGSTEPLGGTPPVTNSNPINNAPYWLGIGGTGGMTDASFSSTPYAMCFTSSVVTGTEVVVSSIANTGLVVATCPSGTLLLGGGARATPASDGSMKPIASYPTYNDMAHDSGAIAAKDGDIDPDSWAAYGYFGSSPATYAFAICGTGTGISGAQVKVHWSEAAGPTSATTGQTQTVGCNNTGDGTLLSGGAAISGGSVTTSDFALPGSQGDHLNGSYPSDVSGNPVGNGSTTATYWTAYTHTGGQSSSSTYTDVWALCGSGM